MSTPAKTARRNLDGASLNSYEPDIAALRLIPLCHSIDNFPDLLNIILQKPYLRIYWSSFLCNQESRLYYFASSPLHGEGV
jgi:hypothetical protein